jgi:hypothetical protein
LAGDAPGQSRQGLGSTAASGAAEPLLEFDQIAFIEGFVGHRIHRLGWAVERIGAELAGRDVSQLQTL